MMVAVKVDLDLGPNSLLYVDGVRVEIALDENGESRFKDPEVMEWLKDCSKRIDWSFNQRRNNGTRKS